MKPLRPLVAGNWKMHGSRASAHELVAAIVAAQAAGTLDGADIAVFPPNVYLAELIARHADSRLIFGAQDVSEFAQGAYTGETAAGSIDAIERALSEPADSPKRARRKEIAREHSLENIAALLARILPIGA